MKKQIKKRQTRSQLAAKLKVSRSTLHEWQARGCPTEKGEQAVLSWAMENTRRHEPSDIREAKLAVLLETSRRLKIANDTKEGLSVPKQDVQQVMSKGMGMLFNEMDRKFSIELPAAFVGLDAPAIQKSLLHSISELKAALRSQWGAMVEE